MKRKKKKTKQEGENTGKNKGDLKWETRDHMT